MQTRWHFGLIVAAAMMMLASPDGVASALGVPVVRANANTTRAGVLHNGVLTVALEARESLWYLDGRSRTPNDNRSLLGSR